MRINTIDGMIRCPFCAYRDPTILYDGEETRNVSGYLDGSLSENETDSEYIDSDFSYKMECCEHDISWDDTEAIYDGSYEINEECDEEAVWDGDSVTVITPIKTNIDPISLLLNKI